MMKNIVFFIVFFLILAMPTYASESIWTYPNDMASSLSYSAWLGYLIQPKSNLYLINATLTTGCTATHGFLINKSDSKVYAIAEADGLLIDFDDVFLQSTDEYYVLAGKNDNSSYTRKHYYNGGGAGYPNTTDANINISKAYDISYGEITDVALNIKTIATTDEIDTTSPTYDLNSSNETLPEYSCLFQLEFDDDTSLETKGQYIFSTNNTGTWINASAVNFTSTPQNATHTADLNASNDTVVGWCFYASDKHGNWNRTSCDDPFTLTTNLIISSNETVCFNLPQDAVYHLECLDTDTLMQIWNIGGKQCVAYKGCDNGCDSVTNTCNPLEYQEAIYNIVIVIAIIITMVLVYKFAKMRI